MIARLEKWYKELSRPRRLLVIFCSNWVYWFVAWRIGKWVFEEPVSLKNNILHTSFMAFWMTLIFRWHLIRSIFNTRSKKHEVIDQ